jgi:YHS domain-containing protein
MSRTPQFMSLSVLVVIGLLVAGCSQGQSGQKPAAPSGESSQTQPMVTEHGGHQHGEAGHVEQAGHGQYEDALAELSPEDRALVEKQKTCPVSGEPLGAMGKPYKVTVQGRVVFLCCPGCEAKLRENPEKYLANIPQ